MRFLLNLVNHENHRLKNRELHIRYKTTANDTVNNADDTVKSVYNTVVGLIIQDRAITAVEISERLQISLSTAKRKLKELKNQGIIRREGSDKAGYWKINR